MFRCLGQQRKKSKRESIAENEEAYYSSLRTPAQKKLKRSIAYSNLRKRINESPRADKTYCEEETLLLSPERDIEVPRRAACSPTYDTISEVAVPFEQLHLDDIYSKVSGSADKSNIVNSDYEIPRRANVKHSLTEGRCVTSESLPDCIYSFDLQPELSEVKPKRMYIKKSEMPRRHNNFSTLSAQANTKFDRKKRLPAFRKKNISSDDSILHMRKCQGINWRRATVKMSNEVIV